MKNNHINYNCSQMKEKSKYLLVQAMSTIFGIWHSKGQKCFWLILARNTVWGPLVLLLICCSKNAVKLTMTVLKCSALCLYAFQSTLLWNSLSFSVHLTWNLIFLKTRHKLANKAKPLLRHQGIKTWKWYKDLWFSSILFNYLQFS